VTDDPQRNIEIHIPSELGYEKVVMEAATAVARRMGFSPDRIQDLRTAVAEACLNAMEHGNKLDVSTKVAIVLTIQPDSLEVNVADTGKQPIPAQLPQPGLPPAHRGWGMFLIEKLMDEVQVSSEPNGNQVRMVIYLDS
jgi:serine/threonine-protein kinase RsbW